MSDAPTFPHYHGLIADWYDDWLAAYDDDIRFYTSLFSQVNGRVLELACGTGRILLALKAAGVTVDGLDSAEDMLAVLQRKAEACGYSPLTLYQQPMQSISLTQRYDAAFVSGGSLQLLASPDLAMQALRRIRDYLNDGGFFVTDIFIPWTDITTQDPTRYHVRRDTVRADSSRSIVHERITIDLAAQIKYGTYRYEFYEQHRMTACLNDDLVYRWYWKDEFLRMLHEAGFSSIEVLDTSGLYAPGYGFAFKALK